MKSEFDLRNYKKTVRDVKRTYKLLAKKFDYFYPPLKPGNKFIRLLNEFLQSHGVKKLLDCACGTGRELIPLALTGGYDLVVGSDLSVEMIDQARKKSAGMPITWIVSDWIELPYKIKNREFDAIICLGNPLAHVPSWSYDEIFKSISKMLNGGGILIINRRNIEAELGMIRFKNGIPINSIFSNCGKKANAIPRISFLNCVKKGSKEIITYFTYHSYKSEYRTQILHLIESETNEKYTYKSYIFRTYYEKEKALKRALLESGFNEFQEIRINEENARIDKYAEEIYISAKKG